MAEPLRVVVLRDGDVFVAQCLEIDIAAQGLSEVDAISRLKAVLRAESVMAEEQGKTIADLGPAPDAFHRIYGADVVSRTELKLVA